MEGQQPARIRRNAEGDAPMQLHRVRCALRTYNRLRDRAYTEGGALHFAIELHELTATEAVTLGRIVLP